MRYLAPALILFAIAGCAAAPLPHSPLVDAVSCENDRARIDQRAGAQADVAAADAGDDLPHSRDPAVEIASRRWLVRADVVADDDRRKRPTESGRRNK